MMNGYDVLPEKLDLEGLGGSREPKRTRAQRSVFVRTRRLVVATYVFIVVVIILVVALPYLEQRPFYDLGLPRLAWMSVEPSSTPEPPLPRFRNYLLVELPSKLHNSLSNVPLKPARRIPHYCLDSHLALGKSCFNRENISFDIIWTWVNGSDDRFQDAMADASMELYPEIGAEGKKTLSSRPASKLYRDHDELRHSFRSVLQHFRPHVKQFTLITSDFPFSLDDLYESKAEASQIKSIQSESVVASEGPSDLSRSTATHETLEEVSERLQNKTLRLGQLPSWLRRDEKDLWKDGNVNLKIMYQAEMFREYKGTSFNSYSIESQFPYLDHVDEYFIYFNDDFFFTSNLQQSDFLTSAYGMVFRMDPTLIVEPTPLNPKVSPVGEWGPLGYSSQLLSERFGARGRPYVVHAPKIFSMSLLDEGARIWHAELSATAGHKFRGMKPSEGGDRGDAYMTFMLSHFVVERWREALLWSWVVCRNGGDQDEWGEEEQRKAWKELGGNLEDLSQKLTVRLTERKTLEKSRVLAALRASGQGFSDKTAYSFSSADGYPYGYRTKSGDEAWPKFSGDHVGQHLCTIDFGECIGSSSSASEAFKTIAFEKATQCGDCIIHALRSSSGMLGLSAFLPHPERMFKPTALIDYYLKSGDRAGGDDGYGQGGDVPHLPLVRHWNQGDFSLSGVFGSIGTVDLRLWTLQLLERYRFILGDTNFVFLIIDGPGAAASGVKRVTSDVSLLCMNDDVKQYPEMTDKILRDWQKRRFRRPAAWEW